MLQHEMAITPIKRLENNFHHVTGERSQMRMDEPITDVFHYKSMMLNCWSMYMWILYLEEVAEPYFLPVYKEEYKYPTRAQTSFLYHDTYSLLI